MAQPEIKNRFENSKVYKLECNVTGLIYVGSTTQELNQRISEHKSKYKSYLAGKYHYLTSFEIIKNNDYGIHLLAYYELKDNDELLSKENHWVKKLICVNKIIPGRTDAEYYQDNKIKINIYVTKYNELNRPAILIKKSKYYEKNKAVLNAKKNLVCVCACGCSYTKSNKVQHLNSNKHNKLIAAILPQIV